MWIFSTLKGTWHDIADKLVYTGAIDEYYDYCYGKLEYRTVRFDTEVLNMSNYQGNAVVNYTEADVPFTRIIEHKHFESFGQVVYDNSEDCNFKRIFCRMDRGYGTLLPCK